MPAFKATHLNHRLFRTAALGGTAGLALGLAALSLSIAPARADSIAPLSDAAEHHLDPVVDPVDDVLDWQLSQLADPAADEAKRSLLLLWEDFQLTPTLPESRTASRFNEVALDVVGSASGAGLFGAGAFDSDENGLIGLGGATPVPLPPALLPMAAILLVGGVVLRKSGK